MENLNFCNSGSEAEIVFPFITVTSSGPLCPTTDVASELSALMISIDAETPSPAEMLSTPDAQSVSETVEEALEAQAEWSANVWEGEEKEEEDDEGLVVT